MRTEIEYKSDVIEEVRLICEKYWSRANNGRNVFIYTCKEIGEEFDYTAGDISKIAKDNASLVMLDCQCKNCSIKKICRTRSELVQANLNNWICSECLSVVRQRRYDENLAEIERRRQQALESRQDLINIIEHYQRTQTESVPNIENISVIDSFLLASVIESIGTDNLKSTLSLRNNLQTPLSPSYRLDAEILERLCQKNLLIFNTKDAHQYVKLNEKGDLEVDFFQMNFDFSHNDDQLYQLIIDSNSEKSKSDLINNSEYKKWCQRIQLEESIRYLDKRAKMNDLSPSISEKMKNLLSICLLRYPISEVYYIIWGAVENASSYRNKPNITRSHASNSIYGHIQRRYDDLINYRLQSRRYNRDSKQAQSAIEKVFFDRIYKIKNCGFNCTVDELLAQLEPRKILKQSFYSNIMNVQSSYSSIEIHIPKL